MRFTRSKGDESTIRKVWNDDKSALYGVVGTVGDMMAAKILTYCDYPDEAWVYLSADGSNPEAWFGSTREAALKNIKA